MMRRLGSVLVSCALLLLAGRVHALEFSEVYATIGADNEDRVVNTGLAIFPTLIIPIGGEFEGMGQAYTAVSRDASFFDANPAASATLEYTELTFVHNNWIADTALEGVLYTRRFGDFGIAAGGKFLHVPFTRYDALSRQVAGGRYSEGTVGLNASYNFARSYEFPGVSVGATLKTAYRYVPTQIAADQSAVGLAGDLGVLTRFDLLKGFSSRSPNFAIGAAARNFGPPVSGEPLPSRVTSGIAYSPVRPVIVATDFIVPVSLAPGVPAPSLGGAVGVSVRVTPFFTAQTGMLLRFGGSRFSMGATLDLTDISVDVNYNLDLATQFTNVDRFSVQARLNFGDEGRGALRDLVDRYYLEAWQASALGDVETAIEYSREALELDPTFTPAAELLRISLDSQQLERDLRAIDLESIGDSLEGDPQR
ncbi:MAG: UPF0164 family protein [Spirochaetota bacterium]